VGTTTAPQPLKDLARFWKDQRGRNLGIVGDTSHISKGVSYHLGKDELLPNAYSIRNPRDRDGLTNRASAIDLGKLHGKFVYLRVFSGWLVHRCMTDGEVRRDVREIIYTADGLTVQRWSGIDNKIHKGPGNGDLTHLKHTHISFFRDSETRDKLALFKPFFEVGWGADVSQASQALDPSAIRVALAIRRAGHVFGTVINMADLAVAMTMAGHPFGAAVDPGDVESFI
jgi:hypothetical protein